MVDVSAVFFCFVITIEATSMLMMTGDTHTLLLSKFPNVWKLWAFRLRVGTLKKLTELSLSFYNAFAVDLSPSNWLMILWWEVSKSCHLATDMQHSSLSPSANKPKSIFCGYEQNKHFFQEPQLQFFEQTIWKVKLLFK